MATITTTETPATGANETPSAATIIETKDDAKDKANGFESSEKPSANSEAAKYRTRLRAIETSLTEATARIAAYQRADVLRAATGLAQPQDLFDIGGHSLDAFLTEEGSVDTEAVAATVAMLLELRPGLANGARIPVGPKYPHWGQGAQTGASPGRSTSWAKVLNPDRA